MASSAGYFDVYLANSAWVSGTSTGDREIFVKRVHNYIDYGYGRVDFSTPSHTEYQGQARTCVASNYSWGFDRVVIKGKKGRFNLIAIAFSAAAYDCADSISHIHADCIAGDTSSLSDSRIKQNQQPADQAALCRVFDALEPKTYDRQDNAEMTPEHRLGFIAQDVREALSAHLPNVTNVISERPVGDQQLLALDYSRLTAVLWAKCRNLEARLAALETT
jgi:hypothetical protein